MTTTFSKADLIHFGNYLLSQERRDLYKSHPNYEPDRLEERLSIVNHADIENFIELCNKENEQIEKLNPVYID